MSLFYKIDNPDAAVIKLLKSLSIDIDRETISAELDKHPDYPSLLAISDVLTALNIENTAFRVEPENLANIPCPFIAHTGMDGGNFVVVKLEEQKVETSAELRQEESKLLAKKSPLVQTESALITGDNNYAAKQSAILELDNQVQEEKSKFLQALNSLISSAEDWKSKFVLTASQSGKLSFAGIVQENQVLASGQEVFYVNPGNEQFFGEMPIPQSNMGKIKEGQQVLVKLKSYPFEEYGMIKGTIEYIAEVPYKDSVFISKVDFKIKGVSDMKRPIHLKQGMMADAEIITQDATILQRLSRSLFKIIGNK